VLPDVPTVAESGYPGFQVDNMYGVLVPAGTPPALINKPHDDIVQVLGRPEVKATLAAATIDIIGNTPEEFSRYIRSEYAKWAKIVKASGARVE
jgi:tripartite-type tricarboxylate transporter receptor subunit TctC